MCSFSPHTYIHTHTQIQYACQTYLQRKIQFNPLTISPFTYLSNTQSSRGILSKAYWTLYLNAVRVCMTSLVRNSSEYDVLTGLNVSCSSSYSSVSLRAMTDRCTLTAWNIPDIYLHSTRVHESFEFGLMIRKKKCPNLGSLQNNSSVSQQWN